MQFDFDNCYDSRALSKEFINNNILHSDIFAHYLNLNTVTPGMFIKTPFKTERTPSFSFSVSNGELRFKDFSTGKGGDVYDFVGMLFNLTFQQTLEKIVKDFKLASLLSGEKCTIKRVEQPKLEDTLPSKIQVVLRDFDKNDANYWEKYNITPEILDYFDVRAVKETWINDRFWRNSSIYKPLYRYKLGDNYKVYSPLSSKKDKWRTNVPKESIWGIAQLKFEHNVCFITSSVKDMMSLYSLGYESVCLNSENIPVPENLVNWLQDRYEYVVIFLDSDETGLEAAKKAHKKYDVAYLYIPLMFNAKDISDAIAALGVEFTAELIEDLLEQYIFNSQLV